MHRCIELAKLGAGSVAPNPMVGAVLVYEGRIIGEGYHQQYGHAHAEVNCIHSVKKEDKQFIQRSTLYVSLEPCAHFGKTPPCADLIIGSKIPKVVIGCRDPFEEVNGRGIEKLLTAGVEVEAGIMEKECMDLNRRFFTFHLKHRPFIILKWTQSANGKLANADYSRVLISNDFTNRVVHKWRSEEASILVGTNTALYDDPALNARLWNGPNPIRLVIDKSLRLSVSLKLFDQSVQTIVFNTQKHGESGRLLYYRLNDDRNLVQQIIQALYQLKIQSVLVEGGAKLLRSFIDEGSWDEARVISNEQLIIEDGVNAPVLKAPVAVFEDQLFSDRICYFKKLTVDSKN